MNRKLKLYRNAPGIYTDKYSGFNWSKRISRSPFGGWKVEVCTTSLSPKETHIVPTLAKAKDFLNNWKERE